MIDKGAEFIKSCSEKTVLVYDIDGDSIGSAVTIAKTIQRMFGYVPKAYPINHDLFAVDKALYRSVSSQKVKNIIIVDIAVDEEPEYVLKIAKKARVLVIDHHQIHRNLNRHKNVLYVNPHFWKSNVDPVRYCVSKLTYDICAKVTDISDLAWLAGLGIINDYAGEAWKGFLDEIYQRYPILGKGTEPYSFDSNLGMINHMITSGYYHSGIGGGKLAYEACLEVSSPLDILEARTPKARLLRRMHLEVQKDIDCAVDSWEDCAEVHGDLAFIELKTRFAVQSPVSTILSIRNPHKTLVIFRRKGEYFHVSFRRQDGVVDCGKLAEAATKDLKDANGGGHKPAAGAHFLAKDLQKFKENVLKRMELEKA